MAKLIVKKVKKAEAKKAAKGVIKSIADLMRARLGKDIDYSYDKLHAEVKKLFPKSKFHETHYAWYKSKIANGKLKGMR